VLRDKIKIKNVFMPKGGSIMLLEILGTGCAKCKKLEELTKEAVNELGVDALINHITDIKAIMNYGVMTTPALVVDGVVKVAGKIPTKDEIKKLISTGKSA
jgi:small redox-active disulfide protein 2